MVDPEPGYRPRRAFVDPATTGPGGADAPETPSPAAPSATPTDGAATPKTPAPDPSTASPTPGPASQGGAAASGPDPAAAAPLQQQPRGLRSLPLRRLGRRPAPDERKGAGLAGPATAATGGRQVPERDELDELDDFDGLDDDHRHGFLGRRGRLALLVGAMAAVIAVGIALIYAVSSVGTPTVTAPGSSTSAPAGNASASAPGDGAGALLGDDQLLTPAAAQQLDDRTWRVVQTQRPAGDDAPVPACLAAAPGEGEPMAQQKVVQVLDSSGRQPPSALHQAVAYGTTEDATQAFAVQSRTFGGCAATGSAIVSGAAVSDLGDQAVGLVVSVVADGKTTLHTVVLSRTGRVVNVLDAAQPGRALPVTGVAKALAAVTAVQCQPAGGACAATPQVADAPPPLGGDVPGFLATGDLPPVGNADESWVATPTEPPSETFLGSQCETVNWSQVDAEAADSRVYLVASSTKFGLNDIVLTMTSEKAASDFVAKIKADLESCEKRKLTADVSKPAAVKGPGAEGSTVTGWTATVSQKTTEGTQRYRVGIVSSGDKVAYTFLNPLPGGYDLSAAEWNVVAVRAGQRMTQVP